ncbi:hypothetical protein BV22DRAFT_1052242 [Leucogyrophana mollusca]|uniref:Uncharacterized protein n=1 Tax=Leucogyrophana mollusca TaxID=85980 RepID=A0ACB8AYP2_9AGAM|nr:hypothetical protein BV22DRAFT_1052242 [Leucogyrophana mollusca]
MEGEIAEIVYDLTALQQISYVEVAALVIAVYDHVQTFADEVDLIWRGPISPITVLYILNRYLGNTLFIVGAISKEYISLPRISLVTPRSLRQPALVVRYLTRSWGTMVSAWIVQGVMQLRVFAMYHGSKKIGILLGICFLAEIATSTVILWFNIGPENPFSLASVIVMNNGSCAVSGIRGNFIAKTYIPIICFEALLFGLAVRISAGDIVEVIRSGGVGRVNSLMKVLARDSLIYFLSNLILMIAVIIGWVGLPAIYSEGLAVPLINFVIAITNSRLVLGLRARRARSGVQVGDTGVGRGTRVLDEGISMLVLDIGCEPLKI